ncbi:protein, SNF2 family [Opisthorchis viverrini]|uniref:Protein, SNF2 family n=1 Tax=Opisthorchis viverrini TaxID=6198 RepID=A0A1S8WFX5_OPIVI|nr:protein, SNF2 family [Opisthorchis viverrini]
MPSTAFVTADNSGTRGVFIAASGQAKNAPTALNPLLPELVVTRLKGAILNVVVIAVHSPSVQTPMGMNMEYVENLSTESPVHRQSDDKNPLPLPIAPDSYTSSAQLDAQTATYSLRAVRSRISEYVLERLQRLQAAYHEDLAELSFIQSGSLLVDFPPWKRKKSQELMQALCSGHLDPEDLALIGSFMSGKVTPDDFFLPSIQRYVGPQTGDADGDSEEEEEERRLDEDSLYQLALDELELHKRVMGMKLAGLWSVSEICTEGTEVTASAPTPSLSSLAAPPEQTDKMYSDYLFAELQWLSEDFKRERQWKKASAKKLAIGAIKAHRDKTERSIRFEKEEVLRARKLCAMISRMVREWWRQIDKIVHAKQKARLSVKHQQAITSHLGRVLETTEEYTRWLTEGITGNKTKQMDMAEDNHQASTSGSAKDASDRPSTKARVNSAKKPVHSTDSSDAEFTADEAALAAIEDDEETIEQEEQHSPEHGVTAEAELAQLTADAEVPLEELVPPDYFDYQPEELDTSTDAEKLSNPDLERTLKKSEPDGDEPFHISAENSDAETWEEETTIEDQEGYKRRNYLETQESGAQSGGAESVEQLDEIAQLEREATMPLDVLLDSLMKQRELEAEDTVDHVGSVSESELSPSTRESYTTTSSGDESDDDRTTHSSVSTSDADGEEEEDEEQGTLLRELVSGPELVDEEFGSKTKEGETENASSKGISSELSTVTGSLPNSVLSEDQQELETLTTEALMAQPTGTTLSSTSSNISAPFLLNGGTLREYQLVGLSWLAAMYQKRLNGILADEMGLGKTIQTIALLAFLACEHGIWGPHLIVVPTSVILNWEVEFKRWCPGFKIITYFGNIKERKERRKGWTKTNAFHVCITSYRLAIQDASVFKRKKWKYLILDEAQNIKNFKSQRWQTLLTFNSQRRLLLTGTPLQNSLMELWSLMHFLMPHIFQSHRDFQEWFASPLTGMIEGTSEYNEELIARLHKVLRPFLLRRLKADVERQMPKKFEHVIMCRLSRRQRFLYDDFMSMSSTKETLKSGQFLSVMNVLMQLRKVCNHPNLFETHPIISPLYVDDYLLRIPLPRLVTALSHPFLVLAARSNVGSRPVAHASAFNEPDLDWLDRAGAAARLIGQTKNLAEMSRDLPTFVARRCRDLCARSNLITVVDTVEVVDDVTAQRKTLQSLNGVRNTGTIGWSFLGSAVVKSVNEELGHHSAVYPPLPDPLPIDSTVVEVSPPVRPCNVGMPKSILRHRTVERHKRLALIARINERRCNMCDDVRPSGDSNFNVETYSFCSPLGPDIAHLITRMIREPCCPNASTHSSKYPGLTGGWQSCQCSASSWPSRDCLSRHRVAQSPIDEAACLPPDHIESSHSIGPESPWTRHWFWYQDCLTLRMMLSTPSDHLDSLSELLDRFAFAVPAVISSGFAPYSSCPKYQGQLLREADRLQELLIEECLPSVCKAVSQIKNPPRATRNPRIDSIPPSALAWLRPVQLHRIATACRIQFPDPRLIQYDCGKLQRLDLLLRELKSGGHRVLIFTQMTRMLDILEQFLAYHGHRYLRLDGATKVEHRQILMERFNQDAQIFVFILSTRSGGLGVNLTGADTVIFYDSDWNPTMDAQAQDRCHRIGQTRDVHIYRLISERTVEENILRKANQKRFLADVAIEGGRFTTAFFKQNTISELFAEPSGLQDLADEKPDGDRSAVPACTESATTGYSATESDDLKPTEPTTQSPLIVVTRSGRQVRPRGDAAAVAALIPPTPSSITKNETELAALMEACEEENDRIAAECAIAEAQADLAEFDETIPLEEQRAADTALTTGTVNPVTAESDPLTVFAMKKRQREQKSPEHNEQVDSERTGVDSMEQIVERELLEFEATLRPIERFGVHHLEEQREEVLNEELILADAQLSESNETWRLDQLKALHVADEERADVEEDDMLYCYGTYDPSAQLAELQRLERLIAEEEAAADSSTTTPGPRGRKLRTPKVASAKKRGPVRAEATQSESDSQTTTDATPVNRGSSRHEILPGYVENSESETDDYDVSVSGKSSASRAALNHYYRNRYVTRQPVQQWENFEPADQSTGGYQSSDTDWGIRFVTSEPPVNKREQTISGKRRAPSMSFLPPSKMPKMTPKFYLTSNAVEEQAPPIKRRKSLSTEATPKHIFVRTSHFTSDAGIQKRSPSVLSWNGSSPATHYENETVRTNNVLNEILESPCAKQLQPFGDQFSFGGTGRGRALRDATTVLHSQRAPQPSSSKTIPRIFKASVHSGMKSISGTSQSLSMSAGHMTPSSSQAPNLNPSARQPGPCGSLLISNSSTQNVPAFAIPAQFAPSSRNVLPPTTQRPPEPVFPVHSVLNGEVYQQRFTHPVVPPPEFTQVVHRLARPSEPSYRPTIPTVTSSFSPHSNVRIISSQVSSGESRLPVLRILSPHKGVQPKSVVPTIPQMRGPTTTVPAPRMAPSQTIPTIRIVNSDTVRTTPILRLSSAGSPIARALQVPNHVAPTTSTIFQLNSIPTIAQGSPLPNAHVTQSSRTTFDIATKHPAAESQ